MPEPKSRRRWAVALDPPVWDTLLALATAECLSPRSYVTRLIERERERSAKATRRFKRVGQNETQNDTTRLCVAARESLEK